jgi:hypothetical protein
MILPSARLAVGAAGLAFSLWACGSTTGGQNLTRARSDLDVSPSSLDFGATAPGFKVERRVMLANGGAATIVVNELPLVGEGAASFSVAPLGALEIASGASLEVRVVYTPASEGNHAARLVIRSDAATPEILVPLAGTAFPGDPCAKVSCYYPPGQCYFEAGTCSGGKCSYIALDDGATCDDGNPCTERDACAAGSCQGTPKACLTPPVAKCVDAASIDSYASPGACVGGTCRYTRSTFPCNASCVRDVCTPDPCTGVVCDRPPPCFGVGRCVAGSCRYEPDPGSSCDDRDACTAGDVCNASGACAGTPKSCGTPPAPSCVDGQSRQVHDTVGKCGVGGGCGYASRTVTCALGCDLASGACRSTCPGGQHICQAKCVDDTSLVSCGALCAPCPVPANGTATCDGKTCGIQCNTGFHLCGQKCLSDSSLSSCGSLCMPCTSPVNGTAVCSGGACGFVCDAGYVRDGRSCTEINECLTGKAFDQN